MTVRGVLAGYDSLIRRSSDVFYPDEGDGSTGSDWDLVVDRMCFPFVPYR